MILPFVVDKAMAEGLDDGSFFDDAGEDLAHGELFVDFGDGASVDTATVEGLDDGSFFDDAGEDLARTDASVDFGDGASHTAKMDSSSLPLELSSS